MSTDTEQVVATRECPDWLNFFLTEFEQESDRAAVILASAIIDHVLRELLEAYMLTCSSASDPLFDGSNAPLATFSARIECSYRLGLITRDFANGLNTLRKIRNSFAHDVAGCSFKSQSVQNRVASLVKMSRAKGARFKDAKRYDWEKPRDRFCLVVGFFLWNLKRRVTDIPRLGESDAIDCKFSGSSPDRVGSLA